MASDIRNGWDRRGPLCDEFGGSSLSCADHLSRQTTPKGTVYRSEPYQVHDFAELLRLESEWDIVITGQSKHNPGECVLIEFLRRRKR